MARRINLSALRPAGECTRQSDATAEPKQPSRLDRPGLCDAIQPLLRRSAWRSLGHHFDGGAPSGQAGSQLTRVTTRAADHWGQLRDHETDAHRMILVVAGYVSGGRPR